MTPDQLLANLRLPLMQAPMSVASGAELALAASSAGILGCFPTHNARYHDGIDNWIGRISDALDGQARAGAAVAPFAVNINVGRQRDPRELAEDYAAVEAVRAPIVTTNVGSPAQAVRRVHGWGGLVIHDTTTVRHARRAADDGVDGLMLVTGGAGGLAGTLNPFAFVAAVREFFDGLIVLAGGIATGSGILAAQAAGADMVCMGTRFIATTESGVTPRHKTLLVEATPEDVLFTERICGVPGNFLTESIRDNGLDPDDLPMLTAAGRSGIPSDVKPWSMVHSGGHSVATIHDIPTVAALVDRIEDEYLIAARSFEARMIRTPFASSYAEEAL